MTTFDDTMDYVDARYGLRVGDMVEVTAGRKVPKGTIGFVADAFEPYACYCPARYAKRMRDANCLCPYKLEIITADGNSHFVANPKNVTKLAVAADDLINDELVAASGLAVMNSGGYA